MTENGRKILTQFKEAKLLHDEYCFGGDINVVKQYAEALFQIQFFDDLELQQIAKQTRADYLPSEWPDSRDWIKLWRDGEARLVETLDKQLAQEVGTT